MSAEARDLIGRSCEVNPSKRLGNLKGGAADVKAHAWFKDVEWDKLYKREVQGPIIPNIKSHVSTMVEARLYLVVTDGLVEQDDTRNFENYDEEPERRTVYTQDLAKKYDAMFECF